MRARTAICLVPVFAAGLFAQGFGGGLGAGIMSARPGLGALVTGQPYSATETRVTQQTLVGNQITHTQQSTVARDSQGRVSTSETITPQAASGKAPYTRQTIFDPVAGYEYVLDSATMTVRQMPLPKFRGGMKGMRRTPPERPNVVRTNLGTQMVNGVPATGTQTTETIPAGAIGNAQPIQNVRTIWIANTLQVPVQIKTSDARYGTSDMELTNIVQAEPNGALFVVPAGYTIQQGMGGMGRGFGGAGRPGSRRGDKPPAQQ
jgi:hypothetical protein